MGPPPLPDSDINSDSISISDSQTDFQSTQSRSQSMRSQSVQSILPQADRLSNEELELQQEIAELQRRKRIQDLQAKRDELRRQVG